MSEKLTEEPVEALLARVAEGLTRARAHLGERLRRHGLEGSLGSVPLLAEVPSPALLDATLSAAGATFGPSAAGVVPAAVSQLAAEVMRPMFVSKLQIATALLLLVLALLVWQAGQVGPWVLAIGVLRYLFVLGGWLLPWLRRTLPPSRRRQTVCVQQGITLLLCLLPPVGTTLASLMAGLALLALLASFAVDIIYLARARDADRRQAAILIEARTAPYSRDDVAPVGRRMIRQGRGLRG